MKRYIIIGKGSILRVVRYRSPNTVFRFPDFEIIAHGLARSVKDARAKFNELKFSQ